MAWCWLETFEMETNIIQWSFHKHLTFFSVLFTLHLPNANTERTSPPKNGGCCMYVDCEFHGNRQLSEHSSLSQYLLQF